MNKVLSLLGAGSGLVLAMAVVYTACGDTPKGMEYDCLRSARYSSLDEISVKQIMLFDDYIASHGILLTPTQQSRLSAQGDLVGEFELDRPVKYPNNTVEMPPGWLPALPADHPWFNAPTDDDPLFPAWFEVRIVDPLLYDPSDPQHIAWAGAYLLVTTTASGGDVIFSLPAVDSGCR